MACPTGYHDEIVHVPGDPVTRVHCVPDTLTSVFIGTPDESQAAQVTQQKAVQEMNSQPQAAQDAIAQIVANTPINSGLPKLLALTIGFSLIVFALINLK